MSRPQRTLWVQVHRWVGLIAGAVLAVVGATGALLAFEDEIVAALNHDARRVVPSSAATLPPPALLDRIRAQSPGLGVRAIELWSAPHAAVRVTLEREPRDEAAGAGMRERGPAPRPHTETRYVDPYTGLLIEASATRGEDFFRATLALHRWLVLGPWGDRDIGRQVVGACTLGFVLLLLSGLYLRWPRSARGWRGTLWLDPRRRGRARLWNQHVVAGTWGLPVYLVIALTGLSWSYGSYRDALHWLAGVERPALARGAEGDAPPLRGDLDLGPAWSTLLDATAPAAYESVSLRLPRFAHEPLRIRYLPRDPAHSRAFDRLSIAADTGALLFHERYADQPLPARLVRSLLALHTGSYFGLPGRLVGLLAAAALPFLVATGVLLFVRDRARRPRGEPYPSLPSRRGRGPALGRP